MQSFLKLPQAPSKQFWVQLIVLTFFLAWTFLLGLETWQIQQSCTPMIPPVQQSDVKAFSDRCTVKEGPETSTEKGDTENTKATNGSDKKVDTDRKDNPIPKKKEEPETSKEDTRNTKVANDSEKKGDTDGKGDLIGVAGGALAATALAVAEAPVAAVAGVGILFWWLVRTIYRATSGN